LKSETNKNKVMKYKIGDRVIFDNIKGTIKAFKLTGANILIKRDDGNGHNATLGGGEIYEGSLSDINKDGWWVESHGLKLIKLKDSIVQEVRKDLKDRSNVGIKKYGVTLDRKDLDLLDWLQHAYEECLDQALYLKRAIKELKTNKK